MLRRQKNENKQNQQRGKCATPSGYISTVMPVHVLETLPGLETIYYGELQWGVSKALTCKESISHQAKIVTLYTGSRGWRQKSGRGGAFSGFRQGADAVQIGCRCGGLRLFSKTPC